VPGRPVFSYGISRVPAHTTPTAASTVTFIVPAFGTAWGALILGEPIGPELIVGAGMIFVSLVLVLGLPIGGLARGAASRTGHAVESARSLLAARGSSA
jgi:drug/metabolite transporter (DMT)-like permease